MKFVNRDGAAIADHHAWGELAGPVRPDEWRPGRSAWELARDWIEGHAAARATALLDTEPELRGIQLETGIAEKKTEFDDFGGPRNHDLLVRGRVRDRPVVVAVEAKADEPFGRALTEVIEAGDAKPGSHAGERARRLLTAFFGSSVDDSPELGGLGYQLLPALAGTLADARDAEADLAVLLIHEFVTSATKDMKHEANAEMLARFVHALTGADLEEHGGKGWLSAPRDITAENDRRPASCRVWVGKLVTRRR